ncbi:hypothetical protein C8R44DRAFT_761981 [Mycena epipterygia]|nr:hypothetical protein C8R44DRAFT_761981 [Mycena epipterygia]
MRLPTSTWRLVRARERGLGAQASDAKRGRRRKDEDVALRHDSAERKKRRGEPET